MNGQEDHTSIAIDGPAHPEDSEQMNPVKMVPESNDRSDPSIPPADGKCPLLEMPGEVLSQIASYLPLSNLVPFLSLNPILLSLTRSHLSPIPPAIRSVLSAPPYPQTLAVIPHLTHFLPPDKGDAERLFVQILVRARPRWIVERFEHGRWDERIWQDAFERRFLRSWKRLKGDDDSWRAVFLRTLGKLEHRLTGCTHEEAWTRFVTLHRNGSASINRMYSRTFDPYEIYDELKHQNNFSSQPTSVRVVLHLQDVRILAFGVLVDQPSLFVNPNAHLALHPPLLRYLSLPPDVDEETIAGSRYYRSSDQISSSKAKAKGNAPSASPVGGPNEAYFPLVRSMSPSSPRTTSYGLSMAEHAVSSFGAAVIPISGRGPSVSSTSALGGSTSPPQSPSNGSLRSAIASYIPIPGRRRTSSSAADHTAAGSPPASASAHTSSSLGAVLTLVRSRDSDDGTGRRRTWSVGRARTNSASTHGNVPASATAEGTSSGRTGMHNGNNATSAAHGVGAAAAPVGGSSAGLPALTEVPSPVDELDNAPRLATNIERRVEDRPYDTLERPQPALSHSRYPNFTPRQIGSQPSDTASSANGDRDNSRADTIPLTADVRKQHFEVDDEYEGGLWGGDVSWSNDGVRMAEWDEEIGKRRRWVGPMILVAQLHPSTKPTPHPSGVPPTVPLEGANPDLGPKGMYASLGFEDLEALFPWIELKSSGAWNGDPRRSGLGF
ncbi:hypothetical protein IAT40_002996 [Kwoniella sp. CBS 6097]